MDSWMIDELSDTASDLRVAAEATLTAFQTERVTVIVKTSQLPTQCATAIINSG